MKLHLPKALFTALLAAFICASVTSAAEYTIGDSDNNDSRLTSATSEDTIIFNKTQGHLTSGHSIINAAVQIEHLTLTNGYSSDTSYTFKNTITGSGEFSFVGSSGGDTQVYVFEGDMSGYTGAMSIAANKTGSFTFKGIAVGASSITGANVQFTDGSSSSALINIKVGRTLIIGHEAQGSYGTFQGQSVDLSGATVNLNGGAIRFNGDDSKLGTLNVNASSTLRLEDGKKLDEGSNGSGAALGSGLNISTLNISSGSDFTINNQWKGFLDIDKVTGTGAVTFNTKNGNEVIKVKVDSVDAGVIIKSNQGSLQLGDSADSIINLSNTINNTGSITVVGALTISDTGKYDLYQAGSTVSYSHSGNGYLTSSGSEYYIAKGTGSLDTSGATVTFGSQTVSLSQITETDKEGYVFSTGEFTDKNLFYINTGEIVANTTGYTDMFEAKTYVLAKDTSLDVNGCYFAEKSFVLGAGSVLKNLGSGLNGNYKMFQSIELTGDATVNSQSNMGLLAFNSSDAAAASSSLTLGGHTLTKTGSGAFFLTGTNVTDAGTIKIESGTLQVGIEVNLARTADTNAEKVDFQLAGGTLEICKTGNMLTAKSLSGTGTVKGEGLLLLNNTGTAEDRIINANITLGALRLTGNDNYTINGNLKLSGNADSQPGYLLVNAGNLTLGEGTHSVGSLDVSQGGASDSMLTLENGAHLTANNNLWLGNNAGITVKSGASFSRDVVKIEAKSANESATVSFHSGSGDTYSVDNVNYTFSSAKVSVTAATNGTTLKNKLTDSALHNVGSGTLTATNAGNNLSGINASTGNINLQNVNLNVQNALTSLSIADGMSVGAHVGTQDLNSKEGLADLTVSGTASFAASSKLYANLTLNDGATLTINNQNNSTAAVIEGSLTLLNTDKGITLAGTVLDTLDGLQAPGSGEVVLFTGVDTLVLGGQTYSVGSETLNAGSNVKLSDYFSNDRDIDFGKYYLAFDASTGDLTAGLIIPEPTTATLSLLALAGLCARRRRK